MKIASLFLNLLAIFICLTHQTVLLFINGYLILAPYEREFKKLGSEKHNRFRREGHWDRRQRCKRQVQNDYHFVRRLYLLPCPSGYMWRGTVNSGPAPRSAFLVTYTFLKTDRKERPAVSKRREEVLLAFPCRSV